MVCKKCGANIPDGVTFCPYCGETVAEFSCSEIRGSEGPLQNKVQAFFKDKLFLALCILESVCVGISLVGGNINVLGILFTVFLWLIYSGVAAGNNIVPHMRTISGVVYAEYIIFLVVSILLAILTFFCLVTALFTAPFIGALNKEIATTTNGAVVYMLLLWPWIAMWQNSVVLVILAPTLGVMAFGFKKIHRFAKSLYQNAETPENIVGAAAARGWIIALSVFSCLSFLGTETLGESIMAIISAGAAVATNIITVVLINKYFVKA